jgi:hypothetical protein
MIARTLSVSVASYACVLALSAEGLAQSTASTKAAAEALFRSGVSLTERGRVAEACAKFDASYQIDAALGTLFRLADCYDRIGRTASAWALFSEAKAKAQAAEQSTREAIAAERVRDLEPRLTQLSLDLGANTALPGLEVRLNDAIVPQASWGLPLPVDPGSQRVQMSAPGHQAWAGAVMVEPGPGLRRAGVPELKRLEVRSAAPATAARAGSAETLESSAYPRWLGYSLAGAGLVGLGIAGGFGYHAHNRNQQSLDECSSTNANACTTRGDRLRDDAQRAATISTVLAASGGALLVGGITLVLLAPSTAHRSATVLRLRTMIAEDGARAGLEGAF